MTRAGVLYDHIALIDTSAAVALIDDTDQWHEAARVFFKTLGSLRLAALDITGYETYTRTRYRRDTPLALSAIDFLRSNHIWLIAVLPDDVEFARANLERLAEHKISFHDALCHAVMTRIGIYKVVTFDRDFWILGCAVIPGVTG